MRIWLIDLCFALVMLSAGIGAGWWLGTRPIPVRPRRTSTKHRHGTEDALRGLHEISASVRACVDEHTACLQAIKKRLADAPTEMAQAGEALLEANESAQHRIHTIQRRLGRESDTIREYLEPRQSLLLSQLSLDRQKRAYQKVLASLDLLATEMAQDIQQHDQRLHQITAQVAEAENRASDSVVQAVGDLLDANGDLQQRIGDAEATIQRQAEQVSMQAVLSHVDIQTGLPNRRGFDIELQQQFAQYSQNGRSFTLVTLDLDGFQQVNAICGHTAGDRILHEAARTIKQLTRGNDFLARDRGTRFCMLLPGTTLAQALPLAERHRQTLATAGFRGPSQTLSVTASLGVAQILPEEDLPSLRARAEMALSTAKQAGRNATYWHDGNACHPVNVVHKRAAEETQAGTEIRGPDPPAETQTLELELKSSVERPVAAVELSSRSAFCGNVRRRIAEWHRGGPTLSVVLVHVDQYATIVSQFGPDARSFLRDVVGRLLEAATRDMDERCEYDEATFSILLPAARQVNAITVARRLWRQVGECSLRVNDHAWQLSASVGLAECSDRNTTVDVLTRAEAAVASAVEQGGNAIYVSDAAQEIPIQLGLPSPSRP